MIERAALALVVIATSAAAQVKDPGGKPADAAATANATAKPAPASLADEYAALLKRSGAAGYGPKVVEQFQPEFEQFAKEHAGTEPALSARLWLLQQCWWSREKDGQQRAKEIVDGILADHASSKQLSKIAEYQYVFSGSDKKPVLERVLEVSPHPEVKAAALLALAIDGKRAKSEEARATANERFQLLRTEYAQVPYKATTFGEMAAAHLDPIPPAELKIGKQAPEIVGKDVDGNAMKLSDYRGKVVVLDFWGFW